MIRLKVPLVPDENILNKLFQKNVCTVNDFLKKNSSELQSISDLPCKEITKLKDNMTLKCSSPFLCGYEFYLNRTLSSLIQTRIPKLDSLLGGGLFPRCIYELCGPSACGKTQLCFSILLNVIVNTKKDIIYIDTNNDFSAVRLKQILKTKFDMTNQEIIAILKKIYVYSVLDIYSLMTCLHSLKEKMESFIIIDSLSALFLSFVGFHKNNGLCYINHISSVLKYLCKNNATIMVTNLAVKNCDNKVNENCNNQYLEKSDFKPAMGKYWFHTPNTRLMLSSFTIEKQKQISINITKSVYLPLNEKCIINIKNFGVL